MRAEKKQLVSDIRDVLQSSPSFFLISYKGTDSEAFGEFRGILDELEAECRVIPNRLLKLALGEAGCDELAETPMVGDTALVTAGVDLVATAKALKNFGSKSNTIKIKMGWLEGSPCDAADALQLADLPSREGMLAQLLALLQEPATRLVRVFDTRVAGIVYVLNAYLNEKKETA